ncbi:MAG: hypothetical protein U0361_07820 [Nitrospiraceae bacterium]
MIGDPLDDADARLYKPPFVTVRPAVRAIPPSALLHASVGQRWDKAQPPYRPANLPPEPRKYVA